MDPFASIPIELVGRELFGALGMTQPGVLGAAACVDEHEVVMLTRFFPGDL